MDDKVIIKEDDIYGFEVLSPDFKPEIKVKFALDIPVSKRRVIKEIFADVESKKKEGVVNDDEANKRYGEMLIKTVVLNWNLYGEDGELLPICSDTIDNRLNSRLSGWLINKAMSFFTNPDKQEMKS